MEGFTPLDCRRFCSCQSIRNHQNSTDFNERPATDSISITWKQQNSIDFNRCLNLVRDQGVGGSNPLSPTNLFKHMDSVSGFSSTVPNENPVQPVSGCRAPSEPQSRKRRGICSSLVNEIRRGTVGK